MLPLFRHLTFPPLFFFFFFNDTATTEIYTLSLHDALPIFSFSGIVTFKNAKQIKEVAQRVPLERILIETDAPYLAPAPHRGRLNQPAYVKHVAEEIATLRGISLDEAGRCTTENFRRLFKL